LDQAADLIFSIADYRYDSSVDFGFFDESIFHEPEFDDTGTHRLEGIFIACGRGIQKRGRVSGARILDIAPTVLCLLGLEVPQEMDGKVLSEVIGADKPLQDLGHRS
jgi:predicted AlkP superfamily phosphohydrolase/phosphomutase